MAVFNVTTKLILTSVAVAGIMALPHSASASAVASSNIISLSNAQRSAAGLGVLSNNALLERAAYNKAADMLANGYWAHTSPSGLTPWSFISGVGYSYQAAGENLAKGYSTSEGVVNGWMNSPGHRANLLGGYTQTGVAVVSGTLSGQPTTLVVAFYATPVAAPAPAPKPTPAPAPAPKQAPVVATATPAPTAKSAPVTSSTPTATPAPVPAPATVADVTPPPAEKAVPKSNTVPVSAPASKILVAGQTNPRTSLWYGAMSLLLIVPAAYKIGSKRAILPKIN